MNLHRKIQPLAGLSLLAFASTAGAAKADPATINIMNGDSYQDITVTVAETNSCYEGPYQTSANVPVYWDIAPGATQLLNVGRNSAVDGCVGWLCVKIDPAPIGKEYQCFDIHGGNGVALSKSTTNLSASQSQYPGSWKDQGHVYRTKQIPPLRQAEGRWVRFCDAVECGETFSVESESGEITKLTESESRELEQRVEACAKVAGEGAVYSAESNVCYTSDRKIVAGWEYANEKSITKKLSRSRAYSVTREQLARGNVSKIWEWQEDRNPGNGWTNQPPAPERIVPFSRTCPPGTADPNDSYTIHNEPESANCSRLGKE